MTHGKHGELDLTQGSIVKQIARFSVPLLVGNLFQQLYNTVDSVVVGNFVGKEALAAVGSVGSAINALIGFFLGLATGASVVISQYCGAKDERGIHDSVHTAYTLSLIASVFCTVLGVLFTPLFLKMMSTPPDVYDQAKEYLTIYFAGITGLLIYNIGAGILRAVGDSKRPLYFLCVSAVLNIALDLLFVVRYQLGVAGVAYATILSQFVSAVLVTLVLARSDGAYRLSMRALKIQKHILSLVFRIGLPAAIQSSITSLSNVFVQGYINAFGSSCMAGWTSYAKIDQFVLLPISSISVASTTFVGQNIGARDIPRAKKGIYTSLIMAGVVCAALYPPLNLFRFDLLKLFNGTEDVLYYGGIFVQMMSPFYILCAVNQILAGAMRGAGLSRAPMIIMLCSFVAFRQVYLFTFSRLFNTFRVIALAYPVGWALCTALMVIYYRRCGWETRKSILDE